MQYVFNEPDEIIEGAINVESTSSRTADASPFNLHQRTDTLQFYFKPTFVKNPKEPSNSVEGKLIYERKGKSDNSFPLDNSPEKISRKSIKKGDSLELALSTEETMALYQGLNRLYGAYADMGDIPFGSTTYVPVDRSMRALIDTLRHEPLAARMISNGDNYELIKELLRLLAQGVSRDDLQSVFGEIEAGSLQELSTGLNIAQLEQARDEMSANLGNGNEEDWQNLFEKYQWILSQVFSSPCTILGSKFYAGGKALNSTGGKIGDFIYSNKLTNNVALIEIKTPLKSILGSVYRGANSQNPIYSLSSDLTGAVSQVLDYKDHLTKAFHGLRYETEGDFEAFQPKCIVVIGTVSEVVSKHGVSTFENYRNSLNGITVITFDELLQKVDDLIEILNAPVTKNETSEPPNAANQELTSPSFPANEFSDIPF